MVKLILAIWLGKIIFLLTRFFNIGGGSAAPGLYALKIYPGLVKELARQIPQNVVITGTNGKTTTARLLAHLLKSPIGGKGLEILRNSTGSNLERGVASALLSKVNLFGQIKGVDLGIWELDEAAFNKVVFQVRPEIIVFLNAFRDQLDRYGEVDAVVKNWWETLKGIDWRVNILVNGGDGNTASLADFKGLKTYEFKVSGHVLYNKENYFKPRSGKPKDFIVAENVKNHGLSGTSFDVKVDRESLKITLPVPGVYHIYDFLAAFGVYYLLGLPIDRVQDSLKNFAPAFGRVEEIKIGDKDGYIFLIKNPAGATAVFETVAPELKDDDRLLVALNDNFADGTDVSWIWDADFELIQNPYRVKSGDFHIIASGTRAQDLAVRLKYADIKYPIEVENDLSRALKLALNGLKGRLFILPTYTALLSLQDILAKQGHKAHYWREQ